MEECEYIGKCTHHSALKVPLRREDEKDTMYHDRFPHVYLFPGHLPLVPILAAAMATNSVGNLTI
jgi:hypothetical protein